MGDAGCNIINRMTTLEETQTHDVDLPGTAPCCHKRHDLLLPFALGGPPQLIAELQLAISTASSSSFCRQHRLLAQHSTPPKDLSLVLREARCPQGPARAPSEVPRAPTERLAFLFGRCQYFYRLGLLLGHRGMVPVCYFYHGQRVLNGVKYKPSTNPILHRP